MSGNLASEWWLPLDHTAYKRQSWFTQTLPLSMATKIVSDLGQLLCLIWGHLHFEIGSCSSLGFSKCLTTIGPGGTGGEADEGRDKCMWKLVGAEIIRVAISVTCGSEIRACEHTAGWSWARLWCGQNLSLGSIPFSLLMVLIWWTAVSCGLHFCGPIKNVKRRTLESWSLLLHWTDLRGHLVQFLHVTDSMSRGASVTFLKRQQDQGLNSGCLSAQRFSLMSPFSTPNTITGNLGHLAMKYNEVLLGLQQWALPSADLPSPSHLSCELTPDRLGPVLPCTLCMLSYYKESSA